MKMKIIILILFIIPAYSGISQFVQNSSKSLFSDVKAFKQGDAIMVLITEDTQADNGAQTQADRSSDLSAGVDLRGGSTSTGANLGLGTGNNFQANGRTSRSEKIRSKLSARVVNVEPNGNLIIEGTRTTKINGELQTIVIKGVVRPVDVMQNNSVYSYSILDLTLTIDGIGTVSETQEPGLITKFIRLLF